MKTIKLLYDDKCDYCTEVMQETDYSWETNCLETAFHILCKCQFFSITRANIFYKFTLKRGDLLNGKDPVRGLQKIINFILSTKVMERPPKLTKKDLSPTRNFPKRAKKRKRQTDDPNTNNDSPTLKKT